MNSRTMPTPSFELRRSSVNSFAMHTARSVKRTKRAQRIAVCPSGSTPLAPALKRLTAQRRLERGATGLGYGVMSVASRARMTEMELRKPDTASSNAEYFDGVGSDRAASPITFV